MTTAKLPLRPDLDSLLAALWGVARVDVFTRNNGLESYYRWQETEGDSWSSSNEFRLNSGRIQCPTDHWWITEDPREAMELLCARDMIPVGWVDDSRRAFDARGSVASVMRSMPPHDRGTIADDGFVVTLVRDPVRPGEPTVRLMRLDNDGRAGVFREVQMADGCDEAHPLYSVESTLQHLASMWPDPPNMDALVAWLSLGDAAIQKAEEFARLTVSLLKPWGCPQPERIVWRVGERGDQGFVFWRGLGPRGSLALSRCGEMFAYVDKDLGGPVRPVAALWEMGLQLDPITADAVTIVVPPLA